MRPRELPKVLASCLVLASSLGTAIAQCTTGHQVSVSIPVVLQLRLSDGRTGGASAVDVSVRTRVGVTTIEPGATLISVRANADWHLDARFHADPGSEALELVGRLGHGPWLELCEGARLVGGGATGGWVAYEVTYGVPDVLPDGNYRGTVVYTLTRP